ncbi:alpha/beta-hydrolase [Hypoxylon trugodes]|uniref:alpha/beta-hydrolase n=1 Tax=Hypoxylon trugodes TaxID=326681 RepID=UPI0021945C30|nr:alpha/beta-hydrolase [Hypoxylon trugodes]KAI1391841.1 alpha/beta-hydrolase [Hypoxylon trugodes]
MAPDARPAPKQWQMGVSTFERVMQHHASIRALWETKWREPCRRSVYPFHDGAFTDFEPVFQDLIAGDINDGTSAAYTRAFIPASPQVSDGPKWEAWELQKSIYAKAGALWKPSPLEEVDIPHTFAKGRDRTSIPTYVRVPPSNDGRNGQGKFPAVILLTGLDGYRPDNTTRSDEFLARGWAAIIFEIPGTADSPADPFDPSSPDRVLDSVFAWMAADGRFDLARVLCWGLSSGGYYAVRAAHTHREKLLGVVAHGAGTHHFFDKEWLAKADGHEYPFQLTPALAMKHGYGTDVKTYLEDAQRRFSLLETGILAQPSTRLLLVNGTHDGLMPIEDSMLLFEYGSPKEARFFTGALHMGYPMANSSVYPWMEQVMASTK